MAVLYGISGKATGKKGDTVFSVRKGQQIMRQYNPIVADPKTVKQTNARAKMKLLSQLSAIMAPVLAVAGRGPVTPRNIFTKKNYGFVDVDGDKVVIELVKMQITDSARAMVDFICDRTSGTSIACSLKENATDKFDRVVYVAVATDAEQRVKVVDSRVVSTPGTNGDFSGGLTYTDEAVTILAYGMKDISAKARITFENIEGISATQVAELVYNRSISAADAQLTETLGANMLEGATTGDSSVVAGF